MASPLNPANWFNKKAQPQLHKKSFFQFYNNFLEVFLEATGKKHSDYIQEGYIQNPIVYRCIEERAKGVSTLELEIHKNTVTDGKSKKEVLLNHPIIELLNTPNPFQNRKELLKLIVMNLDTSGSAFILATKDSTGFPIELNILPSIDMTIVEGKNMFPLQYVYKKGTADQKEYPIDQATGYSDVLCIKFANPLHPQQGLSPMSPGYGSVDIFNQGLKFNASLLKNGGRPSGLMSFNGELTDEQYSKVKESIQQNWQGTHNAGSIPILEGGMTWQELGKSPKDMDWLQGMDAAAMYIASVFGVPFPLVIPSSATFNNVKDARIALYENTIIPLAQDILEPLEDWLVKMYKKADKKAKNGTYDNLCLTYNPEKILALEARRNEKADRLVKLVGGGLITPNEAREELGWDTIDSPDANTLLSLDKVSEPSSSNSLISPSDGA